MRSQQPNEMSEGEHLARKHARLALQDQALYEPANLPKSELAAYRVTLYALADEIVGYTPPQDAEALAKEVP
ncbi:hypothetical protein [Photobacterium ganghwense]|uniref:hypothetical protein n=1 Tax=Photobacterium ganghwense TaxID=320778 RepID=UPI001A9026B8|nr:hypothetical protein [Photobacterium ganghwense]QSV17553.1 hypothetical protein FH974_25965 [Photobacterium ganghwense]